MKLKQLQQQRIEEIIKEEMRNLKDGWSVADQYKRSSSRREKDLFEAATPLEQDLSGQNIASALEQTAADTANECIVKFDDEVLKHIASVLKGHGLLSAGEDAGSVYEMLADFDEDSMTLAQQECSTDIVAALEKYISEISAMVAGVYSGRE